MCCTTVEAKSAPPEVQGRLAARWTRAFCIALGGASCRIEVGLGAQKAIEPRRGGVEHSQHAVEGAVLQHKDDDVIDLVELCHLTSQ